MANAWQTVYENESLSCVVFSDGRIGANKSLVSTKEPLFTEPTLLRLTVDGTEITELCTPTVGESQRYQYQIGNLHLYSPNAYEDDGRDYVIVGFYNVWGGGYVLYFYARNVGTYSVSLAASDPVPVSPVKLNPALLVQGFLMGQAIRSMRGQKVETPEEPEPPEEEKTPVAYLYGQERWPAPAPEYDKQQFPYSFMWFYPGYQRYTLYVVSEKATYGNSYIATPDNTVWNAFEYIKGSNEWDGPWNTVTGGIIRPSSEIKWANFDIINKADGTIWMTGSDPVPVYE